MSSEVRFGIDIEINPDDEEIVCQHYRIKKLENLEPCVNLKKISIVASCVSEIEGLEENKNLVHLEIYQALLTRITNISHLVNLQILDLSFNEIRKIEGIDTLVNLEKLFFSNNKISKIENLENLKKLKVLELGANRIRVIENIEEMNELEELWLGKNKIEKILDHGYFPKLKQISLQSNRLTTWSGNLFSEVAPNLTNVYLGTNQLPDPPNELLETMNENCVEELDFSCNLLTEIPKFSKPMIALQEIWLNDNQIADTNSFHRIASLMPNLKTIYMERNPVQKQCPLDYRSNVLANAPKSLEQLDAVVIHTHQPDVKKAESPNVRSILKNR